VTVICIHSILNIPKDKSEVMRVSQEILMATEFLWSPNNYSSTTESNDTDGR